MNPYNFKDFLNSIENENRIQIINKARQECYQVESQSFRVRGSVNNRQMGSLEYAHTLKGLIFFLENGIKPSGLHENEFLSFLPMVKKLINKKQLSPDVLNLFKESQG